MKGVLVPIYSYLIHRQESPTGIAFFHSSKLQVCHNLHILRHQVFKCTAKLGKRTMANVDDKKPVSEMADELWDVYTETKVIFLLHWSGNSQTRE
ncbi:Mobile element protein [Candidatus Enterovibrio escicola]|uniref:Mobile element protein n=2 Tax=Candidatus Enterovibrio escicola TaxID=1927127 RepID=A0A2A5T371_9GAMM|nr:Mobile element protein [Candidatus Enterovibrio escacola]